MAYEYPPHIDLTVPLPSGPILNVRVWPADPSPRPSPFVLWTHGGGFIAGSHFMPLYWLDIGFRRGHKYHLISHNYRLAPQVSLREQLDDCLFIVHWLRENLPAILGPDRVDVDRYALSGDSAGGLLVMLMGLHLHSPAPKAIIDIYGGADLPAMLKLDRDEEPAEWKGEFPAEKLEAYLEDRDRENVLKDALSWREMEEYTEEQLSGYWKSEIKYTHRIRLQAELHIWRSLHPKGSELMMRAVLRPEKFETKEEVEAHMREMSPMHALTENSKNGGKFPPTAFLHGTGDSAVPVDHSRQLAGVLKGMGVGVVECYPEGEEHVFDRKYTSSDVPGWEADIQPIIDFVVRHVEAEN
ncbi:Alpha/Beta hydrolase protein [Immersiella caudata]|uniref:Alpha/Beta hydrolase protein n=1 Tax=Immersiella caudata TaxID=314043 RepID=A0AA39WFR3_9PEZI|nr:Alpha/Beta hydrolase protein [Immersiella caudata]